MWRRRETDFKISRREKERKGWIPWVFVLLLGPLTQFHSPRGIVFYRFDGREIGKLITALQALQSNKGGWLKRLVASTRGKGGRTAARGIKGLEVSRYRQGGVGGTHRLGGRGGGVKSVGRRSFLLVRERGESPEIAESL